MITLFTIPKPFEGPIGVIQRNALHSWCRLPEVQVVLVGDERGVRDEAARTGVEHIGGLSVNEHGTPRLDAAFARVEQIAGRSCRCFVNADVVFVDDFVPAIHAVAASTDAFLVIGETIDLEVPGPLELDRPEARSDLASRAREAGRSRGATAIDYFAFTPGLFDPMPEFVVGRARFDNWLVWRARSRSIVVDATDAILGIHQHHDYSHIAGGQEEAHFGAEAARNLELAGGKRRLYTIHDASHRLDRDLRLRRNLGAMLRLRENARKTAWKLGRR